MRTKSVFGLGVPVLANCYELQFMVYALGGKVRSADKREYGHAEVEIQHAESQLFRGLPKVLAVWMSHGDESQNQYYVLHGIAHIAEPWDPFHFTLPIRTAVSA